MAAIEQRLDHFDRFGRGALPAAIRSAADLGADRRAAAVRRRRAPRRTAGRRAPRAPPPAASRRPGRRESARSPRRGRRGWRRTRRRRVDADGAEQVARDRIEEGAVEVAVRAALRSALVGALDRRPRAPHRRAAGPMRATQLRSARATRCSYSSMRATASRCAALPVAAEEMPRRAPRDAAELLVVARKCAAIAAAMSSAWRSAGAHAPARMRMRSVDSACRRRRACGAA